MKRETKDRKKQLYRRLVASILLVCLILIDMATTPIITEAATPLKGTRATAADVVTATQSNKKGIQGTEFWENTGDSWNGSDAEFKNSVDHVYLNIDIANLINTDGNGTAYSYGGKTYHFNYSNYLQYFEWRIKELRSAGKVITVEVLLGWSDDAKIQKLIYPGGREKGHFYYALNVEDSDAIETLNATFHYLTDVLGQKDCFVQNWILGNEITAPEHYNYCGTYNAETNITIAAKSFDILYSAIDDNSPFSKGYICLAHNWNDNLSGTGIPTKTFIDGFAKRETGKKWNIAYHPYPNDMSQTMWSKSAAADFSHDTTSNYVCASNIEVLTNYIKENYGTEHRVILSEQGFDSKSIGQEAQAASIAYTYYRAVNDDMIDAVIFATYTDNTGATGGGYGQGLFSIKGEKREAYNVFKYMNTAKATTYVDPYKKYITPNENGKAITSWNDDIIWKPSKTSASLTSASIYVPSNQTGDCVAMAMSAETTQKTDLEYRWLAYDQNIGSWSIISGWRLNQHILNWYPGVESSYLVMCEVRVAGNPDSKMADTVGYVFGNPQNNSSQPNDTELKSVGVYLWQFENGVIEGGSVVNDGVDTSQLQYRWLVYDVNSNVWNMASDWSNTYGIHYLPQASGDYLVLCEVRDPRGNNVSATVGVNYRHAIKAICQMPGENGQYAIGIQSFDNPENKYSYEMTILDCNLFMAGLPAWVYTTGKIKTIGDTVWTQWAPQPGYYWTLFTLYDENGNQIDQQCYGFTNM